MNASSRLPFAGFELIRIADTTSHEVEIGKVTTNGETFVVHMIRKTGLPFGGNFLLAKIFDSAEKVELWNFKDSNFDGLGLLARAGDDIVIALVGHGQAGQVKEVVSFAAFGSHQQLSIERKLELKRAAAAFLGRKYALSKAESLVHQRVLAKARAAEEAERAAAAEARRQARQKLQQEVTARGTIKVHTADGRQRYGYPVLETEWPSLNKGTYVVLVDSIGSDGTIGQVIEAFQVKKESGRNPEKGFPAMVSLQRPPTAGAPTKVAPRPVDEILVGTENGTFEVAVYATMDDIRVARKAGLNSGTYVTPADQQQADGKVPVYSVRKDEIETVGIFLPL